MHPCELLCALRVSLWMHHQKNPLALQLATGRKDWVAVLTTGGDDTYVPTPHVIHVCVNVCRDGISFFTPYNKPTICFHTHILSGGDSSTAVLQYVANPWNCCWGFGVQSSSAVDADFGLQAAVEWLCELAAWSFAIKFNYILRLSTYSVQRTITTSNALLQLYCSTPSCCSSAETMHVHLGQCIVGVV